MRTSLGNLLDNAVNYTPSGGKVTVGCRRVGDRVRLDVSDTGIGMPKEMQEAIFNKFYQLDSSATRRYGGVGLGLHVVKTLTELLGGNIEVESEPGKGSKFTVRIPTHEAAVQRHGSTGPSNASG